MPPSTAVATTKPNPVAQWKQEIDARRPAFIKMLPAHVNLERFCAELAVIGSANPRLMEVPRDTLVRAAYEAASLGLSLSPSMRECDIIPRWNSRTKREEATFQPRYMGYLKMARLSGEISKVYAHIVYEGDKFVRTLGTDKKLDHAPCDTPGAPTGVYCVWHFVAGGYDFEYMPVAEVEKIRQRSKAKDNGPWVTDWEEMARKTVVRRASKYMPMSSDSDPLRKAVALDEAREIGKVAGMDEAGAVWVAEEIIDVTDAPVEVKPSTKMEQFKKAAGVGTALPTDWAAWYKKYTADVKAMATAEDVEAMIEQDAEALSAHRFANPDQGEDLRVFMEEMVVAKRGVA